MESISFDSVEEKFRSHIDKKLIILIPDLQQEISKAHLESYNHKVSEIVSKANDDMWKDLRTLMHSEINSVTSEILAKLNDNSIDENTLQNLIQRLKIQDPIKNSTITIERNTHKIVNDQVSHLKEIMRQKFEDSFLRDSNGSTRIWKNEDIPFVFENARNSGLKILSLFTFCKLREPNEKIPQLDLLSQRLISPNIVESYEESFLQEIEKEYAKAVQIRESMRIQTNVPYYMWLVLLYFGFDKVV